MNLLITTQKVDKDDPILGFFHRWIEEFSKHCERVTVICLEEGVHDLPDNVRVLSLGKEKGGLRLHRTLRYIARFYGYVWKEQKNYDSVFVHMNQVYVILGGVLWRSLGKNISLWYTHKSITASLRVAEKFVHTIFTASKESFRLKSKKVQVMGHGIDTELFKPEFQTEKENRLLTVGRISETKNNISMLSILEENPSLTLTVVGSAVTEKDKKYEKKFRDEITKRNLEKRVILAGDISQRKLPAYYSKAQVFVNFSDTGSLDKAVLEALAMNVSVYTTNEAFLKGEYPVFHNIEEALNTSRNTRDFIEKHHSLRNLVPQIVSILQHGKTS